MAVIAVMSLAFVWALLLSGCSSGGGADSAGTNGRRITATAVGGSGAGRGPTVVTAPARDAGGGEPDREATLTDRSLRVDSVVSRPAEQPGFVSIDVELTLESLGAEPISNEPSAFTVVGDSGDSFGPWSDASGGFWGLVGGHSERRGTITFLLPDGVGARLRLFYRPNPAEATVVLPLTIGR